MRRTIRSCICLLFAVFALSACGFTGNLRGNPGFASFRTPSTMVEADREFALSLGPIPIRLATIISRPILDEEDEWISDSLRDVRAVRVYTYKVGGDKKQVVKHVETTGDELVADGWEPLAAVRDDGELVSALVMHGERHIVRGVVVIYEETEELVLVNVIGKIEPETFSRVMEALELEIPQIDIEEPEVETAGL